MNVKKIIFGDGGMLNKMKLTAYQIRKANMDGDNYSKQQHKAAPWFRAAEARWWNKYLPTAEQYTKAEHKAAPWFRASEARRWNEYLPNAEQYTKEEHSAAPGFDAAEECLWNQYLPNSY